MKVAAEQLQDFRMMARQYPQFVEFLSTWRQKELESMPYATNNLDVIRGRVQTLTEMQGVLLQP